MSGIRPIERAPQPSESGNPVEAELTPEQYVGIKMGVGYIRPIPWPAQPDQYVGVRSLSLYEIDKVYLAAADHTRQSNRPDTDREFRQVAEQRISLWYALRNVVWLEQSDGTLKQVRDKPLEPLFSTPQHLRESLDQAQFDKLCTLYDEHRKLSVPLSRIQQLASDQEFDALVRTLKKKPDAMELNELLLHDVLGLISFLLARVDLPALGT